MSIERLHSESASRAYVQQAQTQRANAGASSAKDSGSAARPESRVDTVSLSSNAKSLAAAREAVQASDGDIRHDKVADIKRRLDDGTYQVDAKVLAQKMLRDSQ